MYHGLDDAPGKYNSYLNVKGLKMTEFPFSVSKSRGLQKGIFKLIAKHLKLEYLRLNVFQPLVFTTQFSESLFLTQRYLCSVVDLLKMSKDKINFYAPPSGLPYEIIVLT